MKHFAHDLLANLFIFHNSKVNGDGEEEERKMVCWPWKNYFKAKPDRILLRPALWKWPKAYPYFPEASVFKNSLNPFLQAALCLLLTFQT